uniref:hypothetical protein n=2 Tax=Flavobacterium sp. TaxID=239 RepID=UPI004049B9E5
MLFVLITTTMCSSDDNSSSNNPADVINIVSSGTWRITSYADSGEDETNNYNGYNFTFGPNNLLTANNGTNNYTGYWSVENSNSNDDSPSNDLDFNITFSTPLQFVELSDDWEILQRSATVISLTDVSGGNGGTDFLTFTKN